jgi:ferredoxin-NADP reductase
LKPFEEIKMTIYDVSLTRSGEVANGTMAFHFSKPAGFSFKPGQAVDLVLTDPANADAENPRHAFSIVSAPFEDELVLATRMRDSDYKRILRSMPIGASAKIDGPFGSLTLHKDRTRPAVFIAGGIGITPFMSMLRQAARDRLPHHIRLLYSNRRPEDTAFLKELQQLEQENKEFRLIGTMTEIAKSTQPWNGATEMIDDAFVKKATEGLQAPIYYLVGPPGMVEAMRKTLNGIDIEDDDIRSEDFYGY